MPLQSSSRVTIKFLLSGDLNFIDKKVKVLFALLYTYIFLL